MQKDDLSAVYSSEFLSTVNGNLLIFHYTAEDRAYLQAVSRQNELAHAPRSRTSWSDFCTPGAIAGGMLHLRGILNESLLIFHYNAVDRGLVTGFMLNFTGNENLLILHAAERAQILCTPKAGMKGMLHLQ